MKSRALELRGKRQMLRSRACGVVRLGRELVMRVGGQSRRLRLVPLRLDDGSVGVRRRRLDLRSRGDRLRLRGRGLICGGARPGKEGRKIRGVYK